MSPAPFFFGGHTILHTCLNSHSRQKLNLQGKEPKTPYHEEIHPAPGSTVVDYCCIADHYTTGSIVLAEFHRITNQNLQHTFYTAVDKHTPQLLKLFRAKAAKGGASGNRMAEMFRDYDEQAKDDINVIRTLVLAGLPLYLKEDSSEVFKTHKRDEIDQAQKAAVAIIAVKEDEGTLPFNPLDVLIVLEDDVVISSKSWVSSLVLLFGLLYALHISYPKKLIVFFLIHTKGTVETR